MVSGYVQHSTVTGLYATAALIRFARLTILYSMRAGGFGTFDIESDIRSRVKWPL